MNTRLCKERQCLKNIKSIIDAYSNGKITITTGNKDFDYKNHVYDVSVIMNTIGNHVYNGLYLSIPNPNKKKKGEK